MEIGALWLPCHPGASLIRAANEALKGQTQDQHMANQQVGKRPKDHRRPRRLLTDSSGGPGNRERLAPPSTSGGPVAAMAAQHKGHVADSEARSGPRCHGPCLFREAMAQEPQGDKRVPLDVSRVHTANDRTGDKHPVQT